MLLHPQMPETPTLLAIPLKEIFSHHKLSIMSFFSWRICSLDLIQIVYYNLCIYIFVWDGATPQI